MVAYKGVPKISQSDARALYDAALSTLPLQKFLDFNGWAIKQAKLNSTNSLINYVDQRLSGQVSEGL